MLLLFSISFLMTSLVLREQKRMDQFPVWQYNFPLAATEQTKSQSTPVNVLPHLKTPLPPTMVLGLQPLPPASLDPAGRPLLDAANSEVLVHVQHAVAAALGARPAQGPGTLYISSRRVIWVGGDRKGFAVDFLSVSLHAVSRDPEAYPSPCIYTQIETEDDEDEQSEGSDSECTDNLELSRIKEMRLVPSDSSQLDTIFDIFCQCAELNPEPNEDKEEADSWIFSGEQFVDDGDDFECRFLENLADPIGHANDDLDPVPTLLELQINDLRFEDAEEMEHELEGDHH